MTINVSSGTISLNVGVISGDSLDNWELKFSDNNGDPLDISAYDYYYTVKPSFDVPDTEAFINKLPIDAVKTASIPAGVIDTLSFPLTATETEIEAGRHVHAIKKVSGVEEHTELSGLFDVCTRKIDSV